MKKNIITIFMLILTAALLVSCKNNKENDKLQVVSTFTIITNMVEEIGKDKVDVHNLVPTGTDPHEYEPLSDDLRKASRADIFFYNGFNLEGGKNGWLFKLLDAVNKNEDLAFNLSEGSEPLYLNDEVQNSDTINPHNFISPKQGIVMAENVLKRLINIDEENKEYYEENFNVYVNRLKEIETRYANEFSSISEERRIIVTSERAFQYLAKDYNIKEGFIWDIDTEENGSAEQLRNLIKFINDINKDEAIIKYLFLESNVDKRPMESISNDTNVPIYDEKVYSDEIGKKGEEVDTYIKYLEHNLRVFISGIKGE